MIETEGLEEKLNQILNDPNSMAQILSMAQSFGMTETAPEASAAPSSMPDEAALLSMLQMFWQAQQSCGRDDALLCALKPYLAPERREKLDRAMQLAKLSRIANMALHTNSQ